MKNILMWLRQSTTKPERIFVIVALTFGGMMTILVPPFMMPDEPAHLLRAYQVSEFGIVGQTQQGSTGGQLPRELVDRQASDQLDATAKRLIPPRSIKSYTEKIDQEDRVFFSFPASALYTPVAYLPQAVGVGIAKIIHPSLGMMIFLGRLANLVAFVAMVWFAIRTARHKKWVYACLALFPIMIQQAASLSTDVLAVGVLFIFFAKLHNIFFQKQAMSKQDIWWLVGLSAFIAASKPTNLVLLLPVLFLPLHITGGWARKLKIIAAVGGAGIVVAGLWYAAMHLAQYNLQISSNSSVDQSLQLHHMLHDPLSFIVALFHTFIYGGAGEPGGPDGIFISGYGNFSWLSYQLPLWLIALGYGALLAAFIGDRPLTKISGAVNKRTLTNAAKVGVATFIVAVAAIALALYLTWTPVGSNRIDGIQGRYFIGILPALIPLAMVWSNRKEVVPSERGTSVGKVIIAISILGLVSMIAITYEWFYTT